MWDLIYLKFENLYFEPSSSHDKTATRNKPQIDKIYFVSRLLPSCNATQRIFHNEWKFFGENFIREPLRDETKMWRMLSSLWYQSEATNWNWKSYLLATCWLIHCYHIIARISFAWWWKLKFTFHSFSFLRRDSWYCHSRHLDYMLCPLIYLTWYIVFPRSLTSWENLKFCFSLFSDLTSDNMFVFWII